MAASGSAPIDPAGAAIGGRGGRLSGREEDDTKDRLGGSWPVYHVPNPPRPPASANRIDGPSASPGCGPRSAAAEDAGLESAAGAWPNRLFFASFVFVVLSVVAAGVLLALFPGKAHLKIGVVFAVTFARAAWCAGMPRNELGIALLSTLCRKCVCGILPLLLLVVVVWQCLSSQESRAPVGLELAALALLLLFLGLGGGFVATHTGHIVRIVDVPRLLTKKFEGHFGCWGGGSE
ncbi:hypothetical protein F503_00282 [Ophiostoma piceae UAMH 11346]|uniref:Uncharacterized protein n=1 Tax=Ophiostoma piceae (strain UAMH 11346) TaxID=1262450 RepID=S3D2N9_OPHP1|nr:hypothetical protein F503_00282 [Ophiostoma piceae UAMH 11346]